MAKTKEKMKARFIRLPEKLDLAIQERARQNRRSVNGQIIFELDQKHE